MTRERTIKKVQWYLVLSCLLIGVSLVSYLFQIAIFHRTEDTFFYMLQDIAFVPIQVLLVTFIIARLLNEREKRALLKKLNMLIGAFYSEVGTALIQKCSMFSADLSELTRLLLVTSHWSGKDFLAAKHAVSGVDPKLDSRKGDLTEVRGFLEGKRVFLLGLLANPNLLEHDEFTDLLWAVFHLSEELSSRPSFEGLPATDYNHLSGDMLRAYRLLLSEWLSYMNHLKDDYPYLFSLAVRMNPMDPNANPIIRE